MADNKQGFAGMNDEAQQDIASKGGKASSAKQDMSMLGKDGATAQPGSAKAEGGRNNHVDSRRSEA